MRPLMSSAYPVSYTHLNPERNYRLWVVHDGLVEENMQELDKAVSGYPNAALQFMTIPGKLEQMLTGGT